MTEDKDLVALKKTELYHSWSSPSLGYYVIFHNADGWLINCPGERFSPQIIFADPADALAYAKRLVAPREETAPVKKREEGAMTEERTAGRELDELIAQKAFGINLHAVTPAEIGEAALSGFRSNFPGFGKGLDRMSFTWNGQDYDLTYSGSHFGYGGADGNDGYGLWFWNHREGEPWQQDLEVHVAAWRKRVSPYSTDISAAWQLMTILCTRNRQIALRFDGYKKGWLVLRDYGEGMAFIHGSFAETAPLAICLAFLQVGGVDTLAYVYP